MNKKIISFLTENQFTIDSESAYGYVNDYQVSISQERTQNALYGGMSTTIQIFSHLESEQIQMVQTYMKENKKRFHILRYEVTEMGVFFSIMNHFDTLMDVMHQITHFLIAQNAKNKEYCPMTGQELDEATKRKIYYNSFIIFLNEESVELLNKEIERAELEFQNAPNNYLQGAFGAIFGGSLGAIVWVILGAFAGIISGWIAFLIACLAGLGYDKLQGKPTNVKFIISAVVTLCYAIFSMFVVYAVMVQTVMVEEGISGNPISILFLLIEKEPQVRSGFLLDMFLSLFFGGLGVFFSYFQMRKTLHKKQEKLK
ncbi:MAG: hypothetical protein K2N65_04145 [Anaeroplasmataceae bacterium]|nr:hypothetical protein [Anaeroplasmataceae bacterium]